MRNHRSMMIRRTLFLTLCGLVIAAIVLACVLISRVSRKAAAAETKTLLGENFTAFVPVQDHFLAVDGNTLEYLSEDGEILWTAPLPEDGMTPVGSAQLSGAYSEHAVRLFDTEGRPCLEQTHDFAVVDMACGSDTYAVTSWEEEQRLVHVFRLDGQEVEQLRFPYETVLDIGFYAADSSQLWALSLDSHFTIPVAHMKTFNPGKATTGNVSMNNEVAYATLPVNDQFVTVGTHYLRRWDAAGKEQYSRLIYGWTLVDMDIDARGRAQFLLTPSNTSEAEAPLSSLWYIRMDSADSATEYRLSLPTGTLWAALGKDGVVSFTEENINTMTFAGEKHKTYTVDTRIDGVTSVLSGKMAVLHTANGWRLYDLP